MNTIRHGLKGFQNWRTKPENAGTIFEFELKTHIKNKAMHDMVLKRISPILQVELAEAIDESSKCSDAELQGLDCSLVSTLG
jgi:hypothetical protein